MKVIFQKKPIPVPLNYQPIYKIAVILTILKFGTGGQLEGKASISKLHLYAWGLRTEENYNVLLRLANNSNLPSNIWSFEPALQNALIIALVKDYCKREKKSSQVYFVINEKGERFVEFIIANQLFTDVINKVQAIGNITESRIKGLIKSNN